MKRLLFNASDGYASFDTNDYYDSPLKGSWTALDRFSQERRTYALCGKVRYLIRNKYKLIRRRRNRRRMKK